jgi:TrmH family RNA methyltransferase
MITSAKNVRIKQIRALQALPKARREANAFVVEGVRLAEEALAANWQPSLALYTDGLSERGMHLVEQMQQQAVEVEEVTEAVMKAASDTQNSQGLLLVLPIQELLQPDKLDFVLIPDQVRDPGNLGTLLRSAAAAGVQAVWLQVGTVDAFSPKVVRAGMGAHFRLPIRTLTTKETKRWCQGHSLNVLLAVANKGAVYSEINLKVPLALVIGGEAEGPSGSMQAIARGYAHIPMPGGCESLNAAMAGTLFMFEVARQRNYGRPEGTSNKGGLIGTENIS